MATHDIGVAVSQPNTLGYGLVAETIRLLRSGTLRQDLTNSAYRLVYEKYDWTAVMPQLLDSLEQITHENE